MYRYFFRFVVATLTILTANLLTTAISNYMTTYRNHVKPLTFTLIAMAALYKDGGLVEESVSQIYKNRKVSWRKVCRPVHHLPWRISYSYVFLRKNVVPH